MAWYFWAISYAVTVFVATGVSLGLESEGLVELGDTEALLGMSLIWPVVLIVFVFWAISRLVIRTLKRPRAAEIPTAKVVDR